MTRGGISKEAVYMKPRLVRYCKRPEKVDMRLSWTVTAVHNSWSDGTCYVSADKKSYFSQGTKGSVGCLRQQVFNCDTANSLREMEKMLSLCRDVWKPPLRLIRHVLVRRGTLFMISADALLVVVACDEVLKQSGSSEPSSNPSSEYGT